MFFVFIGIVRGGVAGMQQLLRRCCSDSKTCALRRSDPLGARRKIRVSPVVHSPTLSDPTGGYRTRSFILRFAFRRGFMSQTTVQVISGILCVILIVIIILRRKSKKKTEDEF
jgi:hypothetical protein